jgi:hypothetical protein
MNTKRRRQLLERLNKPSKRSSGDASCRGHAKHVRASKNEGSPLHSGWALFFTREEFLGRPDVASRNRS